MRLSTLRALLADLITCCQVCQYHDGEVVWIEGQPASTEMILIELGIFSERMGDAAFENFRCPNCGGDIHRGMTVGRLWYRRSRGATFDPKGIGEER